MVGPLTAFIASPYNSSSDGINGMVIVKSQCTSKQNKKANY
jgi:hypothetical protein